MGGVRSSLFAEPFRGAAPIPPPTNHPTHPHNYTYTQPSTLQPRLPPPDRMPCHTLRPHALCCWGVRVCLVVLSLGSLAHARLIYEVLFFSFACPVPPCAHTRLTPLHLCPGRPCRYVRNDSRARVGVRADDDGPGGLDECHGSCPPPKVSSS